MIVLLKALFLAGCAFGATKKLSLEEAVRFAVAHSPKLNTFQRQANITEFTRKNVMAAFLPSLDLSTTHGIKRDHPLTIANPWQSEFNLDLTENLYDNGQNITQYRLARLGETQATEQFLLERDRLSRDVTAQYLRFSLAARTLEMQQLQFDLIRKQFDLVARGYRQGWKTQQDFLRFKAQLSRTELDIETARLSAVQEEMKLKTLIAVPLEEDASFQFQPVGDVSAIPNIPSETPSLKTHREYRIAERLREIASLETTLVRRKIWPEIYLKSGAGYRSSNYINSGATFSQNDKVDWNAMLELRFNLWDWGTRSRNTSIALERELIQENEASIRVLDLREELVRLMLELKVKQKDFELSRDLLQLERKNLSSLTLDYRQGKTGYLDYISAVQSVGTAQIRYFSSLYDLRQALYNYLYHQGTLYEAIQK